MPKRISKNPSDINQAAFQMVQRSVSEPEIAKSDISRIMSEMGRKGGKIGGKKRLETMTPEQRSQIALKAAQSRWGKTKKKPAKQRRSSGEK